MQQLPSSAQDPGVASRALWHDERWVEDLHPKLVATLALYCGDREVAEDCAQEALVRLWMRRHRVSDPAAWAYRCAINLTTSTFRRRSAERRAVHRAMALRTPPTRAVIESAQDRVELVAALATLPPRQRQAVLLRYLVDLDLATVAAVMGCAVGTAKSHLARGLAALRHSDAIDAPPQPLQPEEQP